MNNKSKSSKTNQKFNKKTQKAVSRSAESKQPYAWRRKADKDANENNLQDAFAEREKAKAYLAGVSHKYNDPQWYFKQDALLKDVASFSFNKPLGSNVFEEGDAGSATISGFNNIPGVMAISLMPTPGISVDSMSPINLGAQNIYTRVRYRNSGAANYDAPDLMLYYIAMSSVYSAWNWAKRIYGYACTYSATNWYLPKAYALLENIDLDSVVRDLANYRANLNMLANQINAFCVPSVFSYMIRQSWLYTNVYTDSDTTKAQQYLFTPVAFYKYDETTSPNGGILTPVSISLTPRSSAFSASDIISLIQGMIDALQYSSDIGNMSGDTLKEFGTNLFTLSLVEPDYKVEAAYNREVLTQFENAQWMPHWDTREATQAPTSVWNITQDPDTNFIKFKPKWKTYTRANSTGANFLNFHWNNPTPEDVIVASRLNYLLSQQEADFVTLEQCGSEVALRVEVAVNCTADANDYYRFGGKVNLAKITMNSLTLGANASVVPADVQTYINKANTDAKQLVAWTAFDWSPQLNFFIGTGAASTDTKFYALPPLRDWDVYTRVDKSGITAMNALALLSMFNVPN